MLYWDGAVTLPSWILSRLRILGAVASGAATLLYAATWTYYTQRDAPESLLGITYQYDGWTQALLVERVDPGSPAAGAGLEPGDLIVAVNGQPLTDPNPFFNSVTRGRPGDRVRLTVARQGAAPAVLDVGLAQRPATERPGTDRLALVLSIAVTAVFVSAIARVLPRLTADAAIPAGIAAGTVFGLVLFRTGGAVATRVTRRIDRAFFRSAYDARLILDELAQRAPMAMSRTELASLLEEEARGALSRPFSYRSSTRPSGRGVQPLIVERTPQ